MTLGSLFAGIGGFDLGFERAGFETVWQVEIDDYCRRVLEIHFPRAERFGDIRECGAHNLKQVDVICGGFPCQDVSFAGQRAGINGERSGLYVELCRIVRELRPSFLVVENVSALLADGMGRVIGDLAQSGYDCEWDCLPASAFGAYHERDRVFIVAYPSRINGRTWRGVLSKGDHWGSSLKLRRLYCMAVSERGKNHYTPLDGEPRLDRLVHGIPNRMDRLRGTGNAVVPQIAQWIAERIKESLDEGPTA
jgi:DNA (cytosine-5)-methyltransferase 1